MDVLEQQPIMLAYCARCTRLRGILLHHNLQLTRYTNSKHRESDPELSTESGNNHNCLLLEDLAGVVESIKTNLIVGDLYGQ